MTLINCSQCWYFVAVYENPILVSATLQFTGPSSSECFCHCAPCVIYFLLLFLPIISPWTAINRAVFGIYSPTGCVCQRRVAWAHMVWYCLVYSDFIKVVCLMSQYRYNIVNHIAVYNSTSVRAELTYVHSSFKVLLCNKLQTCCGIKIVSRGDE